MKIFGTILLLTFYLTSLAQEEIVTQTLRIDIPNARGATVSEVFEEVNYIPLESNKVSLFNKIDQLLVTDQYYVILDRVGNAILIFEKDGTFHAKIDRIPKRKKPSYPSTMFQVISVDQVRKEIITYSSFGEYAGFLYVFDVDGNFLREQKVEANISEFISIGSGRLIAYDSPPDEAGDKDTTYALTYIEPDGALGKKYFPHNFYLPSDDRWSDDNNLYPFGDGTKVLSKEFYQYEVIELDSGGIVAKYNFVLPMSYSLPKDFLTNTEYDNRREEFIKSNPSVVYSLSHLYRIDDYLLFHTANFDHVDKKRDLIYHLKTGTLLSYRHIQPDSSNSYLPVYNIVAKVQAADQEHFYTSISSSYMFMEYRENKRRNPVYNDVLTQYFTAGSRNDNPVIIQMKLKEGL
ncbi:6-bladed beta-propeller [Albibacterium profundi]|uniref:6-bladed beta-propeller n=1 Tax=Albibacterium profundi TaxID=3134906 RepID=A0ABV5CGF2_9SPHI